MGEEFLVFERWGRLFVTLILIYKINKNWQNINKLDATLAKVMEKLGYKKDEE